MLAKPTLLRVVSLFALSSSFIFGVPSRTSKNPQGINVFYSLVVFSLWMILFDVVLHRPHINCKKCKTPAFSVFFLFLK